MHMATGLASLPLSAPAPRRSMAARRSADVLVALPLAPSLAPHGALAARSAVAAAAPSVDAPYDFDRVARARPGSALPPAYGTPPDAGAAGRRAAVVLHPTSLPGAHGCGDLGSGADAWVDWLCEAGVRVWQVLPLVPPETTHWSPYTGLDGLCGSPLLISLEGLAREGLLSASDVPPSLATGRDADFEAAARVKGPLLKAAARRALDDPRWGPDVAAWRSREPWVEESALFSALLAAEPGCVDKAWWEWENDDLRRHKRGAVKAARARHADAIDEFVAIQWMWDRQWTRVRAYANSRGVRIAGDVPIYVGGQSADVWSCQRLFEIDGKTGVPADVSGVPPDAFSATGQLWGSPLYRWSEHAKEDYRWWARRMGRCLDLHDEARIDHFRGFAGYWAVAATEETAMVGEWRAGPGARLFKALAKRCGLDASTQILAEDLGVITPDVHALREAVGAPGMQVLQFAFGSDARNTHLPINGSAHQWCYAGTHDNDTTLGWWQRLDEAERDSARRLLAAPMDDPARDLFRAACGAVARTAAVTLQDLLRLDNAAGRMNTPGRAEGNWRWRLTEPFDGPAMTEAAAWTRSALQATGRVDDMAWRRGPGTGDPGPGRGPAAFAALGVMVSGDEGGDACGKWEGGKLVPTAGCDDPVYVAARGTPTDDWGREATLRPAGGRGGGVLGAIAALFSRK